MDTFIVSVITSFLVAWLLFRLFPMWLMILLFGYTAYSIFTGQIPVNEDPSIMASGMVVGTLLRAFTITPGHMSGRGWLATIAGVFVGYQVADSFDDD